jgi:hypothetical protein
MKSTPPVGAYSKNPHMDRGGCRVETASNQIDATTSTRWQRIAASLGKDSDWLINNVRLDRRSL